jgi:hypothetical protein
MQKVFVYTDSTSITEQNLKNLNPLLSYHWGGLDTEAIREGVCDPSSPFAVTAEPAAADWFMLPMHWSYYLWNARANMPGAVSLANLAREYQKQILIWFKGDLVPIVPFDNAVVFLPGMIRSKARPVQRACPVFIDDPLPKFGNGDTLYRNKHSRPSVGFCGYAASGLGKTLWSVIQCGKLNLLSHIGRYDFEAVPLIPATGKRARALRRLEQTPGLETNFIIRNKYTPPASHRPGNAVDTSRVYFDNILKTDYTLCLRGYGNWSYRFYETLACGRIPIFIDTDCVLPCESVIDWKKYCVWIDSTEIDHIGEKIADFHSAISPDDFIEIQIHCRELWEEHLTPKGFIKYLSVNILSARSREPSVAL